MGDLQRDLELDGGAGRYVGHVSPDWVVWTPNGGFLAALALRAAGLETTDHAPRAFSCHYLNVPELDEVAIEVRVLRTSPRARSMQLSMVQGSTPILEALVWTTADSDEGLQHEIATMPDVAPPEEVPQWNPREGEPVPDDLVPFWLNMDARMIGWQVGQRWEDREQGPPFRTEWNRFRPRSTFDDPYVDAARSLILIDTLMLPAAMMTYTEPMSHVGFSLDLSVWFHRFAGDHEWLLCEAVSPLAERGLVAGTARVWTRDGRLVASGGQQMLTRRIVRGGTEPIETQASAARGSA